MKQTELELASPCSKTWRKLEGKGRSCRFCSGCEKRVHNLSQMTEANAKKLVENPDDDELCVVYDYDRFGTVQHRSASRLKRVFAFLLVLIPLSPLITACGGLPRNRDFEGDWYKDAHTESDAESKSVDVAKETGARSALIAELVAAQTE